MDDCRKSCTTTDTCDRHGCANATEAVSVVSRDFARGYFCAVAVMLRKEGHATTAIRELFGEGGNWLLADECDRDLFVTSGLAATSSAN